MGRQKPTKGNRFFCTQCGNEGVPIVRRKGAEREAGHLKKLFCIFCAKETNHVECTEFGPYTPVDFIVEFNAHNFNEEGLRIKTYNQVKEEIRNG